MIVPGLSAAHSALHVVLCAAQVKAVCSFVEETGKPAGIGALQDAVDIVLGRKGTLIVPAAARSSS